MISSSSDLNGGDIDLARAPASRRPQQVEIAVTYLPSSAGPYLWHEFSAATVARDFAAIAARRIPVVRTLLSWDAFMPTDRAPNHRRMRDFERMLTLAREHGLRLVPTLFAQTLGDCVMLPVYAVDRRRPRRGVRCITEASVVPGGPRDQYADPLMLEAQVRWLDAMLAGFAHHPAIAAWDLGYDPAGTIRPRRIEDMFGWAQLLADRVHEHEEECRLTLGQSDITSGRAVRLHRLGTVVDRLGLLIRPQQLNLPGDRLAPGRAVLAVALALALAGGTAPLDVEIGVAASAEPSEAADGAVAGRGISSDPPAALRLLEELTRRLIEHGVTGVGCTSWTDWGPRLREAAPADRTHWLTREGMVDGEGRSTMSGQAWDALAGDDIAVVAVDPGALGSFVEPDDYYAQLPDSVLDIYHGWKGLETEPPAILG